jgi:hypothetical protein
LVDNAYNLHSITLQLEHLAFVKALTHHRNHHKGTKQDAVLSNQLAPKSTRKVLAEKHRSLVAVLRLNPDKLFRVWDKYSPTAPRSRKRKRKQPAHKISDDRAYQGKPLVRYTDDESEYEGLPLSARKGGDLPASPNKENEPTGNADIAKAEFVANNA